MEKAGQNEENGHMERIDGLPLREPEDRHKLFPEK